ncbi:MAG: hypothetical protein WD401_02975 [Thermomicrobiaceae bacterium]
MYVRVLHFVCRKETQPEAVQEVYRMIRDEASSHEGFLGSTLLMRVSICQGMALMYWRDEEAASAAGPSIVSLLGKYAHELLHDHPEVQGYDVMDESFLSDQLQR